MGGQNSYNKTIIASSIDETGVVALDFAKWFISAKDSHNINVICLRGNLGAGKTTFTKAFAEALGIDPLIVKSPTYTYFRKYMVGDLKIFHFDYYRLEDLNERDIAEFAEIIEGENNIIVIEWPDRMENELPSKRFEISIEVLDGKTRKILINEA